MENFSTENGETQITERVEGQENHTEDNYRQEIEDIVRGFIIEKDILTQSHEEEINHMRRRFDLERKQLLKQLEMDKEQLIEASRITDSVATARDVNFAVSDAFVSDAGRMQSFSDSSAEGHRFLSGFHRRSNGAHDIDEVDSNLIREIAEVYLRINNGALTSQMRPELDLEDKYEREREALERSFHLEKRELKRKLEEECYRKLEQERIKYEASIADLKTTISELQWQKREAENRVRHEKEKWEMNVERENNETEKRHLQLVQETRKKLEEKHSSELEKQRDRYEENISDLQTDISKLTLQLKELNENLSQEKEIIMSKFERELKEMEQAFLEQRNSLKANFEAEFMVRLENETSLLKTLNIKLKEDLENMEKDKKDVERRGKEERRKLEERFEEEISEMEQRQSEEKRALKIKLEERYQLGLVREKGGLEETIQELSEEIALLKQENAQMEITFAERRDELQRQLDIEREDMRRKTISDREEIRVQVENELSQKLMLEKVTQDDAFRYHERDALIIKAKYDDLETQINALRQEREMLLRDKVNLEENLQATEKRLMELNNGGISGAIQDGNAKLKGKIREKEDELAGVKLENQQLELSLSAMRREKADMEDEITNLKRRLSNSTEQVGSFGGNDSGRMTAQAQESIKQREGEVSSLRREKHDLESRLFSLQRKKDELEDELASLRRKKLEVEDEISALKRDKTDSDNQVASLKKDKVELEDLITNLKRKQSDLEDSTSAIKKEKLELEHEISILKRHNSTMEIEVHRHYNDQQENSRTVHHKHEHEHVTRENISSVKHETIAPRVVEIQYHSKDNSVFGDTEDGSELKKDASEIQKVVTDLSRQRNDLESTIKRLSDEKADLEKDLRTQLEYRRKVLHQETENFKGKDDSEASWVLQRQKDDLERSIASLKEEQVKLESKVSQHNREVTRLEEKLNDLRGEKGSLEQEVRTLKYERKSVEKMVKDAKKEKAAEEGDYKRQAQSGSPRHEGDRNPAGNNKEQQSAVLRQERDTLRTELTNLRKQFALLQTELSTKTVHVSRESIDMDEKEISELKMVRVELEREIAGLRRRKTEFQSEITVVQESIRREENELNNLRKERMELELQITGLQSQNTRLEAEGSVLRDERHQNENEVDRLRKEKADLEKDTFSLQIKALQSENVTAKAEGSMIKHEQQRYDSDVERLTRENGVFSLQSETRRLEVEKADLEKEVFDLKSEKRRLNEEASVLKDQQTRDEYEVERLRREKVNLERDVFSLQSDQRRVETERSLLKDERYREENEVERLRQEKADLEKDVFSLQTEKRRLEGDVSTGEDSWKNDETSMATGLQTTVQDITKNLEVLKIQKEDLQSEITRIQQIKERDEKELQELRREKTEIEIHLSGLRMECNREGQDRQLDTTESYGQDSWRFKANDISRTMSIQEQLEKVKQELQAEITRIQTLKNQEEDELQKLQQKKTEMEICIYNLENKRGRLEMEGGHSYPEIRRDHEHLTDDDKKSGQVRFSDHDKRRGDDYLHSYNSVSSKKYHLTSYNSEANLVRNSYSHNSHVVSDETLEMNAFRDSTSHADVIKEDNDVISLKRERSELEIQICDLRTQLTTLQTEVTGLENRKTILETIHENYASEDARNGQINGYSAGVDTGMDFDITRAIAEDKRDLLIQEYEEQIRELRQKKLDLEQKVSLLEWQLENMKQKLELEEIRHRREISTLNEKNQSFHGSHGNSQDETLREFYQKLSYFLMTGEHSNKEIMEEIEQQISNLQQKADFDSKNTTECLGPPSVKLEKDRLTSETEASLAREYTSQLKAQMETADHQLKTCEKIIHRLYGENTDLTKENLNLEGKLKSASRSQDKLQRKKILLQKLVDKLSGQIGKDALKQSYLVLELDKDVSI